MILSTLQLQPINHGSKHDPCCICGQTQASKFFYDPPSAKFYCADHATFEDLDPKAKTNKAYLTGVMVSRLAAFPDLLDVGQLCTLGAGKGALYLRVQSHPGQQVQPTPLLADWMKDNMLYASADPDQYFLDATFRDYAGQEVAYLSVLYQSFYGGRCIAVVPASNLYHLLGVKQ